MGGEVSRSRRSVGGEYRLSRDSRLREESDWGSARIPADLLLGHHRDTASVGDARDASSARDHTGDARAADLAAGTFVAAVSVMRQSAGPIVGIDVGENFL